MRWYIEEPGRAIASEQFEGHSDHIEMAGEKTAAVITYGVKEGQPCFDRHFCFPLVRCRPNDTFGSYFTACSEPPLIFDAPEHFVRVRFDGILSLLSAVGKTEITRCFYPSVKEQTFFEEITVKNGGNEPFPLHYEEKTVLETKLVCEGVVTFARYASLPASPVTPGEERTVLFAYAARYGNEPFSFEPDPRGARKKRVSELLSEAVLHTGDDLIDTMFAFAKIRAGESLFRTERGLIHCPGGMTYYAAVWCNDECEYAAPWFAFTGDEKEKEAAETSYRWYEPYINTAGIPMPSSIIASGHDYWNGAGDRGDASMILYGLSRFLLTRGDLPDPGQEKLLSFAAEWVLSHIGEDGAVVSDTDELENRISSGINLNTSSLSYGGLGHYVTLLRRMGKDPARFAEAQERVRRGIEKRFGGTVSGYKTYHYHVGCESVRAWNCLPVYMGILDRARGTADAISDLLWEEGSCRSTEGETILWDRSALYYIASLFRMGDAENGWEKLREFASARLLGDHVPYAVEAYPEGNRRHLSAESALFCRIITDGIFGIGFSPDGFTLHPSLPACLPSVRLERIFLDGQYRELKIEN